MLLSIYNSAPLPHLRQKCSGNTAWSACLKFKVAFFSRRVFGVVAVFTVFGAWLGNAALAQTPTSEQLGILKSLPADTQSTLIQSVLGKGDGAGTKTDPRLSSPETIRSRSDATDLLGQFDKLKKNKTSDGRVLRQFDEDPELRADDTVLIDLVPLEEYRKQLLANKASGTNLNNNAANDIFLNSRKPDSALDNSNVTNYGRGQFGDKPQSDEEKERLEKFKQRILKGNPYKLNKFGVLEIPGLPAIPLAGLTADEATKRVSADPDLRDFVIKVALLRLQLSGDEGLKPFGYDLFEGDPTTFAPVTDIQVPVDYAVGAGDALSIQLYGNEPASYVLTVGRDGRINFPKLGPIMVSGLTFDAARATIERQVSQQLIGSRVSVTMGNLRSIRVFVLGEAQKPGSYTVSGLSTMTNALLVSGGVKKIGSLRNIQLKRNGQLVTVLDLYDLLLHGDTSADRKLMPGDVIFIPPIGRTVAVDGAIRRPAIYELKGEKNVAQVIGIAGGLMPDADEKIVQMERILPSRLREMRNINLSIAAGRGADIANGDKLRIPTIKPTLENSVTLAGFVFRPGAFEYHSGLRLSDVLGSFDELKPGADRHYIMIRREIPPQRKIQVVSADLEYALAARGSAADPPLQPRDQIFVFDLTASRARVVAPVITDLELQSTPENLAQIVSIDGRLKAPGRYPLEPTMRVSDLIRAGGGLEDSAFRGDAELTRYEVVDGKARQTDLVKVDLAAIRRGDAGTDISLKPYDVLIVKTTPLWDEPGSIVLAGEVRFPGKYPIHRGETLYSVLQRAGGFTDIAFGEGAVFIREDLKKREKEQIELLTNRFQRDLTALSLQAIASSAATNGSAGASASQGLAIGQQLLEQLRNTKPVGRLVLNLDRVMQGPAGASGDVVLRDGDKLVVPKTTQEVTILGEVQSPTSHIFQAGLSRDDYISKSGGLTQKADKKRIYVVRANGDVVAGTRSSGWFRRTQNVDIHPGDTIVAPLDAERVRALPLWQAVTTIVYNIAISLLALKSAGL